METMVAVLICLPFLMALLMAAVRNDKIRGGLVYVCGVALGILAIAIAVTWFVGGQSITFNLPGTEIFDKIILVGDFVLMALVVWLSFKNHKGWIGILSIIQTLMVAGIEVFGGRMGYEAAEADHIRLDWLTFLMLIIIGVVGVAIGIYAVGYMRGYHEHHKEVKNRKSYFFALIFLFYGAMFGLVTSMNLIWIYFFWEITSVCSFLLIGYTQTKEAVNNSFRALWMNLLGGLAIAVAIVFGIVAEGTTNLYDLIDAGMTAGDQKYILIPIAMLAFASLTKSAQFPFSGWLLGAMVAPTPSSALLHSATMVKAGVYMLVRISMAMSGNYVGQMVYLIGGFTFFAASCLAISQSDAKKVLAYSTVSNLGLIVACAGVGYPETVWAAVFLIIFHAISKSMLFQCVGAIENATGSRDIEDMQGLAMRLPKLAFILMVGIAGMFLAPFGMLISKWAALKAFVDAQSTIMVLLIAFGSSTTMFYWTKWFSKILGNNSSSKKDVTQANEYFSMFLHAVLLIALCLSFPFLSEHLVKRLVMDMFGSTSAVMSDNNIIIMAVMVIAVFVIPTLTYFMTKHVKKKEVIAYMGGANTGDNERFVDSAGEPKELQVSNWYVTAWLSEKKLFNPSVAMGVVILGVFLCVIIGGAIQ